MSPHQVGAPDELVDLPDRREPREVGEFPRQGLLVGLEKPLVRLLKRLGFLSVFSRRVVSEGVVLFWPSDSGV